MEPAKGWATLVAAAEQLCTERPELEFHFYGPRRGRLHRAGMIGRFASSPYPDRIVWHGRRRGREMGGAG